MADEEQRPESRPSLCTRRYSRAGHHAWCLKPEGHDGECGDGVLSGQPPIKSTHMPRKP